MRKVAKITGIIFASMAVAGLLLKMAHVPGGSVLTVFGTGLFVVVFLPLVSIYRFRSANSGIGKAASLVGLFGGWSLASGLLFAVQHWPGSGFLALSGCFFSLVFVLLYCIYIFNPANQEKKFGIFDVLIIPVFVLLFIGAKFSTISAAETKMKVEAYLTAMVAEQKMEFVIHDLNRSVLLDSTYNVSFGSLNELDESTVEMMQYISEFRGKIISLSSGLDKNIADTISVTHINHLNDFDIPTYFMIGSDPANITGNAKPLKAALTSYYANLMKYIPAPSQKAFKLKIESFIPCEVCLNENGKMVSWEWKNFHHKTILETLTTFVQLKTNILTAEKLAIEEIKKSSQK